MTGPFWPENWTEFLKKIHQHPVPETYGSLLKILFYGAFADLFPKSKLLEKYLNEQKLYYIILSYCIFCSVCEITFARCNAVQWDALDFTQFDHLSVMLQLHPQSNTEFEHPIIVDKSAHCDLLELSQVHQMRMFLLDQVPQTSWSGNNDLWSSLQHPSLLLLSHSTHHDRRFDVCTAETSWAYCYS